MKRILVVVDMQNDFVSGSLGTPEAKAIVSNVVNLVREAAAAGDTIWFTKDTHGEDYLTTQEGQRLPVEHCIWKTWGWEIIDELKDYADKNYLMTKATFGSTDLMNEIVYDIDALDCLEKNVSIEFCGLCTDICIISNALLAKTYFLDARVAVHADCCAGVTPESHKRALEAMKMCQIDIIGE